MEIFAYLDPFTGSLVLQVLAMAFFSIVIFFKKVRNVILGFFGYKTKKKSETLDKEPETAAKEDEHK